MASPARRRLVIAVGALAVLVGLAYGAVWIYATVINDAPDALDTEDLDAALDAATTSTAANTTSEPSTPASTPETTSGSTTGTAQDSAGTWVTTEGSLVGYRVAEVLFGVDTEGVGRTDGVEGTLSLDGSLLTAVEFTVDVASITSDDGRRDNQFRGRIMAADEYPTATFTLTDAIDLGTEAVEGATVAVDIVGDLTMRGVTRQVTASVEARLDEGRIGIVGSIPVVFTDFGIVDPSLPGIVVEPDGLVEFVLVLTPA
jgi:polyisoprenoid-binding protein YceI